MIVLCPWWKDYKSVTFIRNEKDRQQSIKRFKALRPDWDDPGLRQSEYYNEDTELFNFHDFENEYKRLCEFVGCSYSEPTHMHKTNRSL